MPRQPGRQGKLPRGVTRVAAAVACLFAAAGSAAACQVGEVCISASAEPRALVREQLDGAVKVVGLWSVDVCNLTDRPYALARGLVRTWLREQGKAIYDDRGAIAAASQAFRTGPASTARRALGYFPRACAYAAGGFAIPWLLAGCAGLDFVQENVYGSIEARTPPVAQNLATLVAAEEGPLAPGACRALALFGAVDGDFTIAGQLPDPSRLAATEGFEFDAALDVRALLRGIPVDGPRETAAALRERGNEAEADAVDEAGVERVFVDAAQAMGKPALPIEVVAVEHVVQVRPVAEE